MMIRATFGFFVAAACSISAPCLAGDITAYVVPNGVVGNQSSETGKPFGTDFDVNSPIIINSLGVFDSGQDGLIAPLLIGVYDRKTELLVASLEFAAGMDGTLEGGSRFKPLATPLLLPAGFEGALVVAGYGDGIVRELDGNSFGAATGTPAFPWTTNDGGGLISFVGSGRFVAPGGTFDVLAYPPVIDTGHANRYASGTFQYSEVPEPSSILLLMFGAIGLMTRCGQRFASYLITVMHQHRSH